MVKDNYTVAGKYVHRKMYEYNPCIFGNVRIFPYLSVSTDICQVLS